MGSGEEPREPGGKQKQPRNFLRDFLVSLIITTALSFVFKLDAGEIVWGFWWASAFLCLIFSFLVAFIVDAPSDIESPGSKFAALLVVPFLGLFALFHLYAAAFIDAGGISAGEYFMVTAFKNIPLIILYVYPEIKTIFGTGLETWQQFVRFFIVFARLLVIALFCFFLGKYIPGILLYLAGYSVAFFPIRIFEDNGEEDDGEEEPEN